jgi:hypothetical protein
MDEQLERHWRDDIDAADALIDAAATYWTAKWTLLGDMAGAPALAPVAVACIVAPCWAYWRGVAAVTRAAVL